MPRKGYVIGAVSDMQLKLLGWFFDKRNAWYRVCRVGVENGYDARAAGAALKGLKRRELLELKAVREPTGIGRKTEYRRYYRITRLGREEFKRLKKERANGQG